MSAKNKGYISKPDAIAREFSAKVLAQASSLSRMRPMAVVTDGLRAYQDAIPKEFYTMKAPRTQHVRIPNT